MADADSPQRAAGAAAKPRTGTGTAAEPGADAAAEPRADAAGGPGTGGGARGRAGLKIHHPRPAPRAHTARTPGGRREAGESKTPGPRAQGPQAARAAGPRLPGRPN